MLYIVENVDDWIRELDFERPQRTNAKECWFLGCQSLEVFVLPGRNRSEFFVALTKSWVE